MKNNTIKQNPLQGFTTVDTEDRKNLNLRSGDTVKVWVKIVEEGKGKEKAKTRLQSFEGLVIARKHGSEAGATFTVRRTTGGVPVEKIFPLFSPVIDKIEILKKGSVRRSKLYIIRDKVSKQAKRILRKSQIVSISSKSDIDEARRVEMEAKAKQEAEEAAAKAEADKKAQEEAELKAKEEAAAKKAEEESKAKAEAEADKKAEEEKEVPKEEEKTAVVAEEESKEEVKTAVVAEEESKEEVSSEKDDLKKIEGIGPKIEEVLNKAGIVTFANLADSKDEETQELIKEVRGNHNAGTWNEQAELARDGKWEELAKLQEELKGGVEK